MDESVSTEKSATATTIKYTNRIKTETIEWRNQRYKKAVTMEKSATRPKEEHIYGEKLKQGNRDIREEKNQS